MKYSPDVGWIAWSYRDGMWSSWLRVPLIDARHFVLMSIGFYRRAYQQGETKLFTGLWLTCFSKSVRLGWWSER
jgi:hypothetical protein